jgi:hypothetical protein
MSDPVSHPTHDTEHAPILEARIETERPSRYLVQFCKHAAAMGGGEHSPRAHLHGMAAARRDVQVRADWSDTRGTVTFTPWGRCTLSAGDGSLAVRIEAADEDGMRQIRDVVTRDLDRFSRRDPLAVTWHRTDTPGTHTPGTHTPGTDTPGTAPDGVKGRRRVNLQAVLLSAAVLLIVGLHLGLAGTVVADSRWTGLAADLMMALVVLKIGLVVLVRIRLHRRGKPGGRGALTPGRRPPLTARKPQPQARKPNGPERCVS